MAVQKIERYVQKDGTRILKVVLKPQKNNPEGGYFYVDEQFEPLVNKYSWYLDKKGYIRVDPTINGKRKAVFLHREIMGEVTGEYPKYVDHCDGVGIDCTLQNLNIVTNAQNRRNAPKCGYYINKYYKNGGAEYRVNCWLGAEQKSQSTNSEDLACQKQYLLELQMFPDYNYSFFADRRNDLDILDLERTGKISDEEATRLHVMRYAQSNAWYVIRYNLYDYFKQHGVPIPAYETNYYGIMVNPKTGEFLNPFWSKENN